MSELYKTVARHLRNQREPAVALKLWEELWANYERSGAAGVSEFVDQLIELPDTDEEELP